MIWMQDNVPDLMMNLYQMGKLKQHVVKEVKQALAIEREMLSKGFDQEEAQEFSMNHVAPPENLGKTSKISSKVSQAMFNQMMSKVLKEDTEFKERQMSLEFESEEKQKPKRELTEDQKDSRRRMREAAKKASERFHNEDWPKPK